MTVFYKKLLCLTCASAALLALCGCQKKAPAPAETAPPPTTQAAETTAPTQDPMEVLEHLDAVLEAGELYTLNFYPNLKSVNLSGSTCYGAILQYMESRPELDVTYTVDLGGGWVANKSASAELRPEEYSYEALMENLQYLPGLTSLSLPDTELDAAQMAALRDAYPQIALTYQVELFGESYGVDTTELDLSKMKSDAVEEAAAKLGLLANLTSVELSNSLSMEEVALLQDSNPSATFHYDFKLFGKSLSTTTETVEYKNQNIGNEGEGELRQALAILDNCSRFLLDNCKIDYEILAAIREDFRDQTNVVWRVYFGKDARYNALTDQEMIRAVYNVTDDTVTPLKYCEGAKYIDMGHNDTLTDFTFTSGMPNLEAFIGSGAAVETLDGFENCKKLYWLEMANCYKLTNIDALAGCESLGYLNISYSKVTSYMALDGLPLERFVCMNPRASTAEQNTFVSIHEGCRTVYYGYNNPWTPWRYDDNGKTFNKYYKEVIREVFNLDYLESLLPKDD